VEASASVNLVATAIGLFTIVNPIGNLPIFLSVTEGRTAGERRRIGLKVTAASVIVLVAALLVGEQLLGVFGIRVDAFRMAGYAILVALAWGMVIARPSSIVQEAKGNEVVAVVPLAFPIIAGPGAIAFVIAYADKTQGTTATVLGIVAILAVTLVTLVALEIGPAIPRALGKTGMEILTRFFGLLLLAIVIGGIFDVLTTAFPGLA
jgi:MarC family membrane protein